MSTRIGLKNVCSTWSIESDSYGVVVSTASIRIGSTVYSSGAYSVRDTETGKRRLFYGETAWSNAARLADDMRWERKHRSYRAFA